MTTSELAYPVVAVRRRGILEVRCDEDILTTATMRELRTGRFDDMTIVDSDGRTVKVKGARFASGKGRFWGYYSIFLDRIIKVELILDDEVSNMPLDELKKNVTRFVRQSGHSWDPGYAREEVRRMGHAETIRELITLLQPHMDMRKFYETLKKC